MQLIVRKCVYVMHYTPPHVSTVISSGVDVAELGTTKRVNQLIAAFDSMYF